MKGREKTWPRFLMVRTLEKVGVFVVLITILLKNGQLEGKTGKHSLQEKMIKSARRMSLTGFSPFLPSEKAARLVQWKATLTEKSGATLASHSETQLPPLTPQHKEPG